jgi:hypothetical protein
VYGATKSAKADGPRSVPRGIERRSLPARWRAADTKGKFFMRKILPEKMFSDAEQSRLSTLRNWVLDQQVTEIEMSERQFWNFAQLQPVAEKPWITFMGRLLRVPNMPEAAQRRLGIYDAYVAG